MNDGNLLNPLEAVTVKQAAELLHVSRPTVENYIKAGALPSVKIGRCRRIMRADLEAFLQFRWAWGFDTMRRPASQPQEPEPPDPPERPASDEWDDDGPNVDTFVF